MPITPPDSGTGYGYSNMHYPPEPYGQQHRQEGGYEYPQSYMQPAIAPGPSAYHYPSSFQPSNNLPPIQSSYYEPMGAPILPPLRINDSVPFADDYQRRLEQQQQHAAAREQQRQAVKEEKATGGVSAKLDYDMDRMTDFVVEATQSMYAQLVHKISGANVNTHRSFQHSMTSPTSFRKWVHQVLSATRLPSATILLSLHYLSDRIHCHPTSIVPGENQIYRLLAVALVLGSKFLDDNTFINRSWSDVTAIKVKELNELERQWLKLISWILHVNPKEANGLQAWIDAWKDYNEKAIQNQQASMRLAPLDTTNVHRHHANARDRFSPYPSPYSATSAQPYEHPSARSYHPNTPYSSVDPWASAEGYQGIDDFYRRQHRYPTLTEFDSVNNPTSDERSLPSSYSGYQQTGPPAYYQSPPYVSAWDQQVWAGAHRYDCGCAQCAYQSHYRPHHMSGYSAQTVVG
nr:meiotically up-regulated gene 80 protein [Quercus suber]